MICPSCTNQNVDAAKFCGRCHMAFTPFNQFFVRAMSHSSWILRRAGAGLLSGFVAWMFIPAIGRVVSVEAAPLVYFIVIGLLGGAFLGTVDGMVEESTPKTMRGALMGGLGGMIGGGLFGLIQTKLTADQIYWGVLLFWGITGAFIGLTSALYEKKTNKIAAGILCGFAGGGVGAILGISVYTILIQNYDTANWLVRRLYEGVNGALIGVTLWIAIGAAERFIIFKRRPLGDKNLKSCDACEFHNPINSWYCEKCGSVLQWAAAPAKLNLSSFAMLDRLQQWFRFLSRLSATTGVVAGLIVFVVCVPIEPFFAFVASVCVAVVSYFFLVIFLSLSEWIQILIRR